MFYYQAFGIASSFIILCEIGVQGTERTEFDLLRKQLIEESEIVFKQRLPNFISKCYSLLKDANLDPARLVKSHNVNISKSNQYLREVADMLMPIMIEVNKNMETAQMGFELSMWTIHEGSKFIAETQGSLANSINNIKSMARSFVDFPIKYIIARADIVSDVVKYPQVEDYRNAIKELDRRTFHMWRFTLADVCSSSSFLLDTYLKNYDEFTKLRGFMPF